jgi:hypothetical protein
MLIRTGITSDDLSSVQAHEHAGRPPIDSVDTKRMLILVERLTESDRSTVQINYTVCGGCIRPQNIDLEG